MTGDRRFLVVCLQLPFPVRSGSDARTWATVRSLLELGEVAVFGIGGRAGEHQPPIDIPIWVSGAPEAGFHHAHMQTFSLESLKDSGWRPSDRYFEARTAAQLSELIAQFDPDVVVMCGLLTAAYRSLAASSGAYVILNCENVESDLHDQIADSEPSPPVRTVRRVFADRVRKLESETLALVDHVWVCSGIDRRLIESTFASTPPITVVPNVVQATDYSTVFAERMARFDRVIDDGRAKRLLCIGDYRYPPNRRAANFVIEDVLPLVGSGVVLDLVGTWPSSTVENAISQNPHVTVRGFVPDLQPFLTEADFVVVALFEGGGTRLKVLEALAAGVPVVASDKAVEGLELGPDLAMWTARTAEDFALSIGSRREPEPVRAAMQRGRDFVEKTYSLNAMVRAIRRTWSS